jgi:hypothetical protein
VRLYTLIQRITGEVDGLEVRREPRQDSDLHTLLIQNSENGWKVTFIDGWRVGGSGPVERHTWIYQVPEGFTGPAELVEESGAAEPQERLDACDQRLAEGIGSGRRDIDAICADVTDAATTNGPLTCEGGTLPERVRDFAAAHGACETAADCVPVGIFRDCDCAPELAVAINPDAAPEAERLIERARACGSVPTPCDDHWEESAFCNADGMCELNFYGHCLGLPPPPPPAPDAGPADAGTADAAAPALTHRRGR